MRRLVLCSFAIITLTACGGTVDVDTGGGTADVTTDVSVEPDIPGDPDVTVDPDVTDKEDVTDPVDVPTDVPTGCTDDADCDNGDPCTVGACNLETGDCEQSSAENGTSCVVNDMDSVCVEGICYESVCGDALCEAGYEDPQSCPEDCLVESCPEGQVVACGQGSCVDESLLGDGNCDFDLACELHDFDGGDCELTIDCGDGVCADDETIESCPVDCDFFCGDETCNTGEDETSCPEDCAVDPFCGDETCDPGENIFNCAEDCAEPENLCGNGDCAEDEKPVNVYGIGMSCGLTCLGEDDMEGCISTCVLDDTGLSSGCADCYSGLVTCGFDSCSAECAPPEEESQACTVCMEEAACTNTFEMCSNAGCAEEADLVIIGGSCPEDCVVCDEWEVESCEGLDNPLLDCVDLALIGDGECNPEFDCAPYGFDGGDCTAVSVCGDGICDSDEADIDEFGLATECLVTCDEDVDCAVDCMMTSTGMSMGCATCSAAAMGCVFAACHAECIDGVTSNAEDCETCSLANNCMGQDYATCTSSECTAADADALATTCAEDCWDGECQETQIVGCDGECYNGGQVSDGICDEGLNCEAWGADGGDCSSSVCGDMVCGSGEAESCPTDCAECLDTEVPTCDGGCELALYYGDGYCDDVFDCEVLALDDGDCGGSCGDSVCASGEGPLDLGPIAGGCAESCDDDLDCTIDCIVSMSEGMSESCSTCFADSVLCIKLSCYEDCIQNDDSAACANCTEASCSGDNLTQCISDSCTDASDVALIAGSCPADCGDCASWGGLPDCWGGCYPSEWYGDGKCDEAFNCPEMGGDMGDCIAGCGNGECEAGEGPLDALLVASQCSLTCEDDASCVTDCLIEATTLTFSCSNCFGTFFGCSDALCGAVCAGDDDAACAQCIDDQGCTADFDACVPVHCENDWDNVLMSGTCPADCVDCGDDAIVDCEGGCTPTAWIGDGQCESWLNCMAWDFDGGDCQCDDGEVGGCEGGCGDPSWMGDGVCNAIFDCLPNGYDGGDCDECGNSYCGPFENTSTCTEDCGTSACGDGLVEDCWGGCSEPAAVGDGTCDDSFACQTWAWDQGDCCPEGQVKGCYGNCWDLAWLGDGVCHTMFGCADWSFDEGDCIGCGDGICSEGEDCPEDCGEPTCGDNEVLGCDWECYPLQWLGDGSCDEALKCSDTDWDNDDCCPDGFLKGCLGACGWADYLGDGECDPAFDCLEMDQDQGDCGECGDDYCNDFHENESLCPEDCGGTGCGVGYVDDCWGGCSPEAWLSDGDCDEAFACEAWAWDNDACCPDGQKETCDGGCTDATSYGDGLCDTAFNCSSLGYDGGDCEICELTEISDCDGLCVPFWMLGGDCDPELNCEEKGWDDGACVAEACGDGTCGVGENLANCAVDCFADDCSWDQLQSCWETSCVDSALLNNDTCNQEFNCAYHSWDAGACGFCGDAICDDATENQSLCPEDCGDSFCADGSFVACDGMNCVESDAMGDGQCDDGFNCGLYGHDGGDCCEDPEMEQLCGNGCALTVWIGDESCDPSLNCEAGGWDGGDCDVCGDDVCGLAENSSTCPEDCTAVGCADGEIEACDGACLIDGDDASAGDGVCDAELACAAWDWDGGDCCSPSEVIGCDGQTCVWEDNLGDGQCDESLDCDAFDKDGGDCCDAGEISGCDGVCVAEGLLGDGTCQDELACGETAWDDGDCCMEGFIHGCDGQCIAESILGDEWCDMGFACEEFGWDGGGCCAMMDMTPTCDGSCAESDTVGDGTCDDSLRCAETNWDDGDCCPEEQVPTCWQTEGEPLWCAWPTLGDGFCDDEFDCAEYDYDSQDCIDCGDGVCAAGEDEVSCNIDCAPQPGDNCTENGINSVIDCYGVCYMESTTNGVCDEAFNCEQTGYDWGDCQESTGYLVINEVNVQSVDGSETEFIEIYNPTDDTISLSNYQLYLHSAVDGTQTVNMSEAMVAGEATVATFLYAGEFLVVGLSATLDGLLNGSVMLSLPSDPDTNDDGAAVLAVMGAVVDSVAWSGDASVSMHAEGTPVSADGTTDSLSRCPDGEDTDDNLTDFWTTSPSPGEPNLCDSGGDGVTFGDVHSIFQNKCGSCHTNGSSGGHSIGSSNMDSAYDDSQLTSYGDNSKTKGEQAAARILSGGMPQGKGCGGPVEDDASNNNVCITWSEYDLLLDWIDAGQPAP